MGSVPPAGIRRRELPWCPPPVRSPNMDTLATSLMDLWNTPGVAEKLEETARGYFANSLVGSVEEVEGQVMAQTSRSAMATELLHHPTVPRSLLMEHQNLPTELQHPPMTPRQPQTATTPQPQP